MSGDTHISTHNYVANIGDCQDLCGNHATCKSVNFHPGSKECNLKNADTSTVTLTSPCYGNEYSEPVKGRYYCHLS